MIYSRVYDMIGLRGTIRNIAEGSISLTSIGLQNPFRQMGFPPALIPIWSEEAYPRCIGLWKHWFSTRNPSFVVFDGGFSESWEIARSSEQLFADLFAQLLGYKAILDQVDQLALKCGVDIVSIRNILEIDKLYRYSLLSLPIFKNDPPLSCFEEPSQYPGDYPHNAMTLTPQALRTFSEIEADELLMERIRAMSSYPSWFSVTDQPRTFKELLNAGDLSGAWLSLNSTGWQYSDARVAIQQLAEAAKDKTFSLLARTWSDCRNEEFNGY